MARVMVKCPTTGKPADTGMDMDKKSFDSTEMRGNVFSCPHCGQRHIWDKKDAYLEDDGED